MSKAARAAATSAPIPAPASAWRNRIVGHGHEDPRVLVANPRNWRAHPDHQQQALLRVMDAVGWVAEITVNRKTGFIVDGHLRVAAAIQRGEALVPVRYVELSEDEEGLILATLDPIGALAETDRAILSALIKSTAESDPVLQQALLEMPREIWQNVAVFGYDPAAPVEEGDTDPDAVPEPRKTSIRPGDLFALGEHRLLCGDSTVAEDVALVMAGKRAELMATDPPYGVDVAGGTRDPRDKKNYRSGPKVANDDLKGEKLRVFLQAVFTVALPHLTPGAAWYTFFAGTESRAFEDATELLGGKKHLLVWEKPNFVFGRCDYHYQHEPILYGWVPGAGRRWYGTRDQSSVWKYAQSDDVTRKEHATVKPVGCFVRPIVNHTKPGDVVYEPFAGYGSQLIAAQQFKRRCYAIEINPVHCQQSIDRWEAFSGETAERLQRAKGRRAS